MSNGMALLQSCLQWLMIVLAFFCHQATALNNGVGRTPPMGWNSWNFFGNAVTEKVILETGRAIVQSGLAAKGYKYVNIDDNWSLLERDAQGNIQANPESFPHGIKWLADQIHGMGLKLGIYGCSGVKTCTGLAGSWGHEEQDARLFAAWEIDYLKYDNCFIPKEADNEHSSARFGRMRDALNKTGRPIFYSIANWGQGAPARWPGRDFGNSWRTCGDIVDTWESTTTNIDNNHWFAEWSGPGGWNDPDMLEVGNGAMTTAEYRTHFSLWAISKAPLIIGCDVRNMTQATLEILSNEEVIAVNQDPLGIPGTIDYGAYMKNRYLWAGKLSGDRVALILHNRGETITEFSATCLDLNIPTLYFTARDLWKHKDVGQFKGRISTFVPTHDVAMYVISYDKHDQRKCDKTHIPSWKPRPYPKHQAEAAPPPPQQPTPSPPPVKIAGDSPPVTTSKDAVSNNPNATLPPSPPPEVNPFPPPMDVPIPPPPPAIESRPSASSPSEAPSGGDVAPTTTNGEGSHESSQEQEAAGPAGADTRSFWGKVSDGEREYVTIVITVGTVGLVAAVAMVAAVVWWAGSLHARKAASSRGVKGIESKAAYELVDSGPSASARPTTSEGASEKPEEQEQLTGIDNNLL